MIKDQLRVTSRKFVQTVFSNSFIRETLREYTQRGSIPKKIWGKFPVNTEFEVCFPYDIRLHYVSSTYDGIGRWLYWKGVEEWEYETIEVFCRLSKHARKVLDIGANTGIYSLIACAAHHETTVMAFEPVPRIYEQLQRSILRNNFQDRCSTMNAAVSDSEGEAQFHVPNHGIPTVSSLHLEGFRGIEGTLITVPLVTIDGLLKEDEPVDLVKIDVEGFEDHVLRGMLRTIQNHQPAIILECNVDGPIDELNRIFQALSYSLYHLRADGPVLISEFRRGEDDHYRNFLLLPESKSHWLVVK